MRVWKTDWSRLSPVSTEMTFSALEIFERSRLVVQHQSSNKLNERNAVFQRYLKLLVLLRKC